MRYFLPFVLILSSLSAQAQTVLGFQQKLDIPVRENGTLLEHPWTGGINAVQVNSMDLNQDGREDLVLFDRSGDRLLPFVDMSSSGAPQYSYAPEWVDSFPPVRYWMLLRDYNCDGKKDIFTKVQSGVGVYENTSQAGQLRFDWALGTQQFLQSEYGSGNISNISVTAADIPGIVDMNNDGAIDILTFALLGVNIQLHQNRQPCGLDYFMRTDCWGGILEGSLSNALFLDTCDGSGKRSLKNGAEKNMHAGSTLLPIDLTGNGSKDLLLGDVSFNNVVAAFNTGHFDTAYVSSQDINFPSNDTPVDLYVFPAAFYEDVNGDGHRDLLVSPNIEASENAQSLWYYENTGTDANPQFSFVQEDFLQEEMIETGEAAAPVLFDFDNDGLLDLFVGTGGDFQSPGNYTDGIRYYRNTGSPTAPEFDLESSDFAQISSLQLGRYVHPAFGDLDGDSLVDLILGDNTGKLHFLRQTASGQFQVVEAELDNIDVGHRATPFLYDMDGDGALDLLVGEQAGNVNYYRQVSPPPSLDFTLETETYGGVRLLSQTFGGNSGFSVPVIQEVDGQARLFVGSFDRGVVQYDSLINATSTSATLEGQFGQDVLESTNIDQTPFGTSKRVGRNQYLIRADELVAEGLRMGWIDRITFEIASSNNPIIYDDLYFKMGLTTSDSLTGYESGLSDVYNNTFIPFAVTQGWNSTVLHTPFWWDGESNIVIEICFSKNAPNPNIRVKGSLTPFRSNAFGDVNNNNTPSADGCQLPLLGRSRWRPNIRLRLMPGLKEERAHNSRAFHLVQALGDLNGDTIPDMILGNLAGGLEYFEGIKEVLPDISVEEDLPEDLDKLIVYPNPSNGFVRAELGMFNGPVEYVLYDLRGIVLSEGSWIEAGMQFALPKGIYVLQLTDGHQKASARWMVR